MVHQESSSQRLQHLSITALCHETALILLVPNKFFGCQLTSILQPLRECLEVMVPSDQVYNVFLGISTVNVVIPSTVN